MILFDLFDYISVGILDKDNNWLEYLGFKKSRFLYFLMELIYINTFF